VFGKRAGEYAARFAKENSQGMIDDRQVEMIAKSALLPFDRAEGENPFQVQFDLQEVMQNLVGIVRNEQELLKAMDELKVLNDRFNKVRVIGNREYNNGWHTALDLQHLLTVSEAVTRAAIERKESRGAHFREDHPEKDALTGNCNLIIVKGDDGQMMVKRVPVHDVPPDLKQIIEEMK
jgi:succinate dehydrogenase / fumarate reductase flavoprotein subunit